MQKQIRQWQTQTHSNDHGVRTFRPTSPLPTPGEKSTITTGFSTLTRITFITTLCRFSMITDQRPLLTLGFLVHRKLHNTLGFLAHRKPYNTHNVTNINLFSTIDENSIKHNSMLQSLTTLIYYVCKYNKLKWVCVTMSEIKIKLNSIIKSSLRTMIIKQVYKCKARVWV